MKWKKTAERNKNVTRLKHVKNKKKIYFYKYKCVPFLNTVL